MPLSLKLVKHQGPPRRTLHKLDCALSGVPTPHSGPGPARLMIYVETQAHAAEPPSTPRMRASTTRELTGQAGQRAPSPLTGIATPTIPTRPDNRVRKIPETT